MIKSGTNARALCKLDALSRLIVPLIASAVLVLAGTASAEPRTLFVTPKPISELAHDGGRIAWISRWVDTRYGDDCGGVWVRTISTKRQIRLASFCVLGPWGVDVRGLAFDGQRALWTAVEYGRESAEGSILTAAVADRRLQVLSRRPLAYLVDDDRTPLVYAWAGETTWQVVGRRQRQLENVPPLRDFSVAAGRVALVPADEAATHVEIRRVSDGALLGSVPVVDEVRTLALSSQTLAVLLEGVSGKRIERYDLATRTLVGSTAVPADTTASLDFGAGGVVVFRAGRTIWRLGPNGRTAPVWTTTRRPIEVSVEGRRVVWAANGRGRGRVLALTLPAG